MNMRNDIVESDADAVNSPFRHKPLVRSIRRALVPGLLAGLASVPLAAAPAGGQVRAGNAAITHDAARGITTVKQNSQRTAIDWRSFDVGPREQVRFKQPNVKATALNRIFDHKPSEIFGKVKANGRVVLMNPNGVFFRPGAEVNVGGLIAGAMRVGVDEFMSGRYQLKGQGGSDGRVVNQGTITVAPGGEVALLGKSVANEGVIVATAGRVNLVAGEQTTVDFDGDGLLRFRVDKAVIDNAAKLEDQVANSGQINADGGQILITASAAAGVFDKVINNSGVIKAGRIDKQGGTVRLVGLGPGASVLNTGQLDASATTVNDDGGSVVVRAAEINNAGGIHADARLGDGGTIDIAASTLASFEQTSKTTATSSDGAGGEVSVTGQQLAFNYDAAVDVSGYKGGGRAQLGGGFHGNNSKIVNAEKVFVGSDTSIKADAITSGDGGEVAVWSDDTTRFHGKISARGGRRGGDGGFVEVSSKQNLLYRGAVDTSAARGTTGTLLLDPASLTITDAAAAGEEASFLPSIDAADDNSGGLNTISWGDIDAQAVTANIVLEASGLVTVNDVTGVAGGTITGSDQVRLDLTTGSLTIRSTGGNIVFADTDDVIETKGGAITLSAASGTITAGGLRTNVSGGNGAVTIVSNGNASFGDITTSGAVFTVDIASGTATQVSGKDIAGATALSKLGAGTLTLDNANTYTGTTTITAGSIVAGVNNVFAASILNIAGGTARFEMESTDQSVAGLAGSGFVSNDEPGTNAVTLTINGGSGQTFGGNFFNNTNDSISVVKTGVGTQTLSVGGTTYAGTLDINNGTLSITTANSLGDTTNGTAVSGNGTLNLDGLALASSEAIDFEGSGIANVGALTVTGTASMAASVNLSMSNNATIGGSGTLTLDTDLDNGGSAALSKTGTGTLILASDNSAAFTGAAGTITVNAGVLRVTDADALGDVLGGTTVANDAQLEFALGASDTVAENFSIEGNGGASAALLHSSANVLTLSGAITLTNVGATDDATISVSNAAGELRTGAIDDGAASLALNKAGTGTLLLSAVGNYNGVTHITAGTLKAGVVDLLSNGTGLDIAAGATYNLAGLSQAVAKLDGVAGALVTNDAGSSNGLATLTITGGGGGYAGDITENGSDTLSLVKSGTGTQSLSVVTGSYDGTTTVSGGTLSITTAASLGSTVAGTVVSGGTLNLDNLALSSNETLSLAGSGAGAAGALTATGSAALGAGNLITLTADSQIGGTGQLTINSAIDESGGARALTKSGVGNLVLAGNNTYSGATNVAAGVLTAGATDVLDNSSGVNLTAAGATLNLAGLAQTITKLDGVAGAIVTNDAGNTGAAATLTVNGDGGSFAGDMSDNGSDVLALTKSGSGTQSLAVVNGSYTGATTISAGTLSITSGASLGSDTGQTTASGGTLNLNGLVLASTETINLSGTGNADIGALSGSGTSSIAASNTLTLTGDARFGGAGILTLNAAIGETGGARALTKTGDGTLILVGNNSYSGATTIAQGTLQAGAADVLDNSSGLNLSTAAASFNLAGFDQAMAKLDGVASSVVTNNSAVVADIATLTITAGGGNFAGNITDSSGDTLSLTKAGSGIQILAGSGNTYTGTTSISGGALQAGAADLFGQSAGLNVSAAGATFNLAGFDQSVIKLDGVAGALVTNDAGSSNDLATLTITGGDGNYAGDISENGSDTLSITKFLTGAQILSVASGTYDGATTVSGGTLHVTTAASFGSSVGGIVINNATNAAATLDLATAGGTSISDSVTFAGGNNPTLLLSSVGTTTLTGGIIMSSAGTANIAQASGTLAVATVGISGAGTLTKSGSGTLQLAVATTLGGLNLSQGVLAIGLANALAASTNLTLAAGTSFNLNGFDQTIASLSGTGTVTNDDAVGGSNAAATLTIAAGGGSFAGDVTESADDVLSLTKSVAGTQILASTNSYTGATTVSGGSLQAGAADILTSTSSLNLTASGTTFNLAGFDQSLGALTGVAGSVVINNAGSVGDIATLTITSTGGSFAGDITQAASDTLSFTKAGGGTQTLSGTGNTYTGPTTVNGGTLQAGANNVLGATAGLVLSGAGATFNLAGFDQQLGKLDGGAGTIITNNAGNTANSATLTITAGGGSFSGDITETGSDTLSVAKSGAGTQILAVVSGTYDGTTTVSGGILHIDTAASLGSSAGQTTASTGTLDLGTLALASGETLNLTGSGNGGAGALTGTASVAVGNAIVLSSTGAVGTTGTLTINSIIAGSGNLSKVGTGNVILTGANTFTGSTAVAQGTLTAGAVNVLIASSGLSVASSASFNLAGFAQAVSKLDGVAGAVVANDAGGGGANALLSITAGGGSYAGNLTQNGLDDLSLTKSGSGVQSLSVVSGTYAGATLISGGSLSITTAASLGTDNGQTTANGGTLDLNGLALASSETINLSGTGNGGAGALTGSGTASVAAGNVLTLSGDASFGGAGSLTLSTALGDGGGARNVTKTGAGTLIFANANNTYSGATLVAQGTLQAGAVGTLDNSTGLNLTASGATFNLAGFDQTVSKLDGVAGSVVTNNATAVADGASLDIVAGGGSFAGDMTETGGDTLSVVKSGTGAQVLSVGIGTYNGTTTISGGILRAATTASLGSTSGTTTVNGGTLEASFSGTSNEALVLNGTGDAGAGALRGISTGTFAGTVNLASASIIGVDNGAAGNIDFQISGVVSGGAGSILSKVGADTLVLAGTNSYSGATQIDAGTLKLGAAGGVGNTSVVSMAAGATFDVNDQAGSVGALGGGSGTLDLGLGSLAAADDIDLSGITVVIAVSGTGNQTLSAGTDGSGTLTIDALSKSSTGNLTLSSPTLIDINGNIAINAGNLTISNGFSLAGDLTASGNITLVAAGSLDGATNQTIDAQGGTLSTVGLTKTAGANGNLILGGGTAITATGDIDVQSAADDLIIADNITANSALSAARNVIFQGAGTNTFNGAGAQTITAGSGVIGDTAGAVLAKSGGADLILNAGDSIGVDNANAVGVALGGGSGLQASAGTDVFVTSAVDLTVKALTTGAGDNTVDIRTTGASASLSLAGPYTDVAGDSFTLVAASDLNFTSNTLTVESLDAAFGQSGTASDFDIDQVVSASGGFTLSGGAASGDRIDASNLAGALDFVSSTLNAGSIGNGLVVDGFSGIETIVGGSGNDSLAGDVTYTVSGADTGSASLFSGTWSAIENLTGSSGADMFNIATGGSLSGIIDGLGGADSLSYASRAAAITIDLATPSAPDVGSFANIESFVGGSGNTDHLIGTNNASNWTVNAANSGTVDDTTVGAPASLEFNFVGFENLSGGTAADTFTISAAGSVSGLADGGSGVDTLTYVSRASAVSLNLQSATLADSSSTFANFAGFETFAGSAAVTDRLLGRNQDTDWNLTASGAGTIDDTPAGAPDGTPEFNFTAFETLQGGSAVDTFTAATGGALSFTQLAGGAGNDVFNIVANGAASTVLTSGIVGENDNDTVLFGVHENSPPSNPASTEFSRVVGSIDLGAGIDTLDYSGSDLVLLNAVIDNDTGSGQSGMVRDASTNNPPNLSLLSGNYTDVDAVVGNGTQLQGADVETVWIITGNGRGRYGSTFATATTTFENFSIRGGNKRDVFIFKQEGPSNTTPQLFSGIDGGDFIAGTVTTHNHLQGSSGADQLLVTGATAVFITLTGGSGTATTEAFNINNIGDAGLSLSSGFTDSGADTVTVQAGRTWAGNILTNGGADTLTLGAGARIAGTMNLGAGSDTVDASAFTTAITARVTSANASGMSASTSSFAGDFVGIETLNLGSGGDTITLTVAPTGTANTVTMGAASGDTLSSLVDATWVLSSNGAGQLRGLPGSAGDQLAFSGIDNLSTSGDAVLSVPAAAASIAGTFTAASVSMAQASINVGDLGLRIVGDVNNNNPLTLTATGSGDITIRGNVIVDGALRSNVAGGTARYDDVITAGADQTYNGATTVRGDVTARDVVFRDAARINGDLTVRDATFAASVDLGGPVSGRNLNFNGDTTLRADVSGHDLRFNGPLTIIDSVKLLSSSNIFDFNDEVLSDADAVLSIVPTANTDMVIDLEDGAGHVAADRFANFEGTLAIGGEFSEAVDGDVLNGTVLSAPADYVTVSESLLTGGNVLLIGSTIDFSKGNNITIGAGDPGEGTIVVMALGDKVQVGNNGLTGRVTMGNIAAPSGGNTVTFTGGRVMLAATNEVENSQNMVMDLNGGEVLVAQGAQAANARVDFNVRSRAQASTTNVTDTVLINSLTALGAPSNLLQNTRASFPNPAAILTILQAVAFVDSSLFEEDLTLFGVIGDGIAKSLDQCEDAEGCAPSVTEEQLTALIDGLQQRIAALEKSLAAGDTATAKGETLLSQYRSELASYLDYQQQLRAYLVKQQQDDVGSDDFEDVFEAEENLDPATEPASDTPAAEAPVLEEAAEDLFAPLEEAPVEAAPEPPLSDIDEEFETLDDGPASAAPQAAPVSPPATDETPAPADDFEELEELPDATLLNEVLSSSAVRQLAGLVRLDAEGAVMWSGEVILPTLHRRY